MSVVMYVCMDINRGIGSGDSLPWSIPKEMSGFLGNVSDKVCVVGSLTYDGLPKSFKRNHECVIYTRTPWGYPDLSTIQNLSVLPNLSKNKNYAIIGGSKLYEDALPFTDVIEMSVVIREHECTHFFPEFDEAQWLKIYNGTCKTVDKHGVPVNFIRYRYIRK